MVDVLVVGAGPAGATAALVLERAGARVLLIDRAEFPRPKLCGDTLNPGTLAILRRLGVETVVTAGALPIRGMRLTGPRGVSVEADYGRGLGGMAQTRCEFDHRLLREALAAGADFEPGLRVTGPRLAGHLVTGVAARRSGDDAREIEAAVTIAADGRQSVLARAMGLSRQPVAPRRWAIGAYYESVAGLGAFGEMHVRAGHYLGVAPLPGGLANVILVVPWRGRSVEPDTARPASDAGRTFASLLDRALEADPDLRDRFSAARRIGPPTILGPLAVDVRLPGTPGLLLAGDAAGFIDPMTGDGMRFAIRGGELAAEAALDALAHGWDATVERLARARHAAFGAKWRFNRGVRRLTGSAAAIRTVAALAPALPPLLRWAVRYAGDVGEEGN